MAPLILTSVLDGGQRLTSPCDRLIPGERTLVPIEYEAGWVPKSGGFWGR